MLIYTVQSHHIAWQALKVIEGRFQGVSVHIENYNVVKSQPTNSLQSEEQDQSITALMSQKHGIWWI